ncbi:hypothetical protein EUGRSUZ_C00034 [Eucalyptus grandis]|uniref:Uncharacterized protein n=2 Tax=Eucalyptus grandis TaxID=71139 RepID=A0ACC3L9N8_EUCGR|nr:hypothetical protein EUGRSUZ_C00034 [Eucalyptus grandis]
MLGVPATASQQLRRCDSGRGDGQDSVTDTAAYGRRSWLRDVGTEARWSSEAAAAGGEGAASGRRGSVRTAAEGSARNLGLRRVLQLPASDRSSGDARRWRAGQKQELGCRSRG